MRNDVSPFLRRLCRLLTVDAGELLWLCSGSFHEDVLGDDRFIAALQHQNAPRSINLIGGMFWGDNGPKNRKQFLALRDRLREEFNKEVTSYVAKGDSWHGKIGLRVRNGQPTAAVIGSSNLTRPAMLENWGYWNFEGDVSIWLRELNTDFRERDRDVNPKEYAILEYADDEERKEPKRLGDLMEMLETLVRDGTLKDIDAVDFDKDILGL